MKKAKGAKKVAKDVDEYYKYVTSVIRKRKHAKQSSNHRSTLG